MSSSKTVLIIQHIFDHFLFKLKYGQCASAYEVWVVPHDYIAEKQETVADYWRNQGATVILFPKNAKYTNTLRFDKILRASKALNSRLRQGQHVTLVDKSTVFSQMTLDRADSSTVYQFHEPTSQNMRVNYLKTAYQIFLSLLLKIKPRLVRSEFSDERRFDFYPTVGRNVRVETIKIDRLPSDNEKRKLAVLFGGRFFDWGLTNKELAKVRIFIEQIKAKKYEKIYYIGHPLESDKEFEFCLSLVSNLTEATGDFVCAEDWVTSFSPNEIDCYSVGSTASKICSLLGYRSFVGYRGIFEDAVTQRVYDQLFSDVEVIHA